jgi:hypothetical protein
MLKRERVVEDGSVVSSGRRAATQETVVGGSRASKGVLLIICPPIGSGLCVRNVC